MATVWVGGICGVVTLQYVVSSSSKGGRTMVKYLVRSPQFRPLTDGDETPLGRVEFSQEGNEWTLVDIEGDELEVNQKINQAIENGQITDFQRESILTVQGVIDPPVKQSKRFGILGARQVENRMGLDFTTSGITAQWQDAVQKKSMIIVGVADTGRVPEAARAAHMQNVELIHVYGGNDTHGHQTACVSRIVGNRGVLNKARRLITAQALPNGRGTTSDIVGAIRAIYNWRGANGERVSVLSLSLGMDGRDPIIDREILDVQAGGMKCVAAMGNSGWGIRSTGTPAAVCLFNAGATLFDGSAPAVFSTGGCNLPEETGAGPGQDVGLAHLDGGYGNGSGTSFSCPVLAALVAGMLDYGWTVSQIKEYLQSRQRPFIPPRRVGCIKLNAEDFGESEKPPVADINALMDEIIWRNQEVDARIEVAQLAREAIQNGTMTWEQLYGTELGPIRDLMREAIAIAQSGKA